MYRLCAIFGILSYDSTGNEYQSSLSTTWESFAYLAGRVMQWYEAVNKHSVQDCDAEANGPQLRPMKSGNSERNGAKQGTQMDRVQQAQVRQAARDPEEVEKQFES